MSRVAELKGIHLESVTEWYRAQIDGIEPPLTFSLITGGRSNLTYRVVDGKGCATVLRRPPTGAVLATAHDMAREYRVISAIGDTEVPVPVALALCEDASVNDAPFYVMDFIEGHVLVDPAAADELLDGPARASLSKHVIDVLAMLHSLDPAAIGLGDLGRREAYVARQLKRWQGQWEKTKTRDLESMERVFERLTERIPEQHGAGVVHGDYRLGNMLVSDAGRIEALLDWELCTLGDPLADLGYLLNNWSEPGEGAAEGAAAISPTAIGGFWTRDQMVERYSEQTGFEVRNVNYYRSFQYWRLAAIVEGVLSRYLQGVMGDKIPTEVIRDQVDRMADAALAMLEAESLD